MVQHDVDPISTPTVFNAQWTRTPDDVYEQVRDLWRARELGNDFFYYPWDGDEEGEQYPLIDAFLRERGIVNCLIHWWW